MLLPTRRELAEQIENRLYGAMGAAGVVVTDEMMVSEFATVWSGKFETLIKHFEVTVKQMIDREVEDAAAAFTDYLREQDRGENEPWRV